MLSLVNTSMPDFPWTFKSERAAELLAEGELTITEIGARVEVTRQTIYNWNTHPEFKSRVESIVEAFAEESMRISFSVRAKRVAGLNKISQKLYNLLEARVNDPALVGVPGVETGLLIRDVNGVKIDATLLREIREHHKQVAQELGQWVEAHAVETSVKVGSIKPVVAEAGLDAMLKAETNDERGGTGETESDQEHEASEPGPLA